MTIEIKQRPAYEATDGSLHLTLEAAAAHSAAEAAEVEAEEFTNSVTFARGQATRAKNIVIQFLKWKAGREAAEAAEEKKAA